MPIFVFWIICLLTRVTGSTLSKREKYPEAPERQGSINDVDSPLWWQNKFQLRPCEIGFPWSISGLRIVERFHASTQVLFFSPMARLRHRTCSLLLLSSNAGFTGGVMESISHFVDRCVFSGNSSHRINIDDYRLQPLWVIFLNLVTFHGHWVLLTATFHPGHHCPW